MSKSIKFKNNVYMSARNVSVSRDWAVSHLLIGQNALSSQNVNTGIYNKLLTITLKGAYLRSYIHLEVADTEMGYLFGDLYIFFRLDASGKLNLVYTWQRMIRRNFNTFYLYVTKNSTGDFQAELWVYTTATWSCPYWRIVTASPITSIKGEYLSQKTEPTHLQKIEFTDL